MRPKFSDTVRYYAYEYAKAKNEVLQSMGYRFECDGTLLGRWARKVEPAAES